MKSSKILMGLASSLLLSAGAAQAGCNLEMIATLPAKIDNGRVFVSGTMAGHPVDYLVDLAARTTLVKIPSERLSIRPDLQGTLEQTATFGEPGPDQFIVEHLPLRVAGTPENFGAPQEVAILGTDFFTHYDVEIDAQQGKIVLYKPSNCESAKLAYWSGPSTVVDMVSNTATSLTNIHPLNAFNYPHINLRMTINGKEMLAALDTGYAKTSLNLAPALDLGLTVGGAGTHETARTVDLLDGFSAETWVGKVESVAMGGETLASATVDFRSFKDPSAASNTSVGTHMVRSRYHGDDMVLGADFLLAHRVFVAYSQNKVYFSPAGEKPFLAAALTDGATLAANPQGN